MQRKKIAFVTPVYLPASMYGSDKYVWSLARDFARRGHDISVITTKALTPRYWYDPIFGKSIKRTYEVMEGVKVYRLPCNFFFSSLFFILKTFVGGYKLDILGNGPWLVGLHSLLKREKFDSIHSSPFPLYFNVQVANAVANLHPKPKFLVTPFFHEQVPDFKNPELSGLFQQVDHIHVISKSEQDKLSRMFPGIASKISVIPLFGTFPETYTCAALRPEIRVLEKKYNLHNRKIVLFVGIKGEMKGAVDLLVTMDMLHRSDNRYLLIALGAKTNEWNNAKKKISPDSLLDIDYVDGKVKHAFFCLSDIFCMPSKSETFGLVYLEAWHKKKPVIAADIPAIRELVGINRGGRLVRFGDRKALGKAITAVMENKKMAKAYGNSGYQAFMRKYRYMHVIRKYLALFDLS